MRSPARIMAQGHNGGKCAACEAAYHKLEAVLSAPPFLSQCTPFSQCDAYLGTLLLHDSLNGEKEALGRHVFTV